MLLNRFHALARYAARHRARWLELLVLAYAAMVALVPMLQPPSQVGIGFRDSHLTFQLALSAEEREPVLSHWREQPQQQMAQLALGIDSLLFLPGYTLLLLGWGLRLRLWRRSRRLWPLALPLLAAGFDLLENGLSSLLLQGLEGAWLHVGVGLLAGLKFGALGLWLLWALWAGLSGLGWVGVKHLVFCTAQLATVLVRWVYLNAFALLSLVLGLGLVGFVPQVHDLLGSLGVVESDAAPGAALRRLNRWALLPASLLWGLSIWASMRSAAIGLDEQVAQGQGLARWLQSEAPRWFAYFGLVALALLAALHMAAEPVLGMALFMGLAALLIYDLVRGLGAELLNRSLLRHLFVGGYHCKADDYRVTAGYTVLLALPLALWSLPLGEVQAGALPWLARIDPLQLALALTALAFLAGGRWRGWPSPLWAALVQMAGLVCWLLAAQRSQAWLPVLLFGYVLALAAVALLLLTERRHLSREMLDQARELWRKLYSKLPAGLKLIPGAHALFNPSGAVLRLFAQVALVLLIAFATQPLELGWQLGTVAIALLALALMSWVLTLLFTHWPLRLGLGNWAVVPPLWLLLVGAPADHSLRVASQPGELAAPQPLPAAHAQAWAQARARQGEGPVLMVAAAGGGIRAAYWTATLLAAQDDRSCGRFGERLLAMSGVSGGSIGLAVYLAQRQLWQALPEPQRCQPGRVAELQHFFSHDFLGPVAGSLLFGELPQAMVPWTYLRTERGATLADTLVRAWQAAFPNDAKGLLSQPFAQQFAAADGRLPALFLNATGVESGRRVIASNLRLDELLADSLYGQSGAQQLFSQGLSVVDAAVNSARFPIISPPGRVLACDLGLPRRAGFEAQCAQGRQGVWGHVVDGGFFENSGIETLMDYLAELPATQRQAVRLIAIDSTPGAPPQCAAAALGQTPAAGQRATGSDLGAPLATLLSVRQARAVLALKRASEQLGCERVVEWTLAAAPGHQRAPPLGWALSAQARALMDGDALRHVATAPR